MEKIGDHELQCTRTDNVAYSQRVTHWMTANPECEWPERHCRVSPKSCLSIIWAHRDGWGYGLEPDRICPSCTSKL